MSHKSIASWRTWLITMKELNCAIEEKMLAHNRKRMQQHLYSREEHFLATEKDQLQSLPHDKFEVRHYADLQVGLNGCIYLGRDKQPTEDVLTCPIVLALFRPSQIHIRLQVHRLAG